MNIIYGTRNDDFLLGSIAGDYIFGFGGSDTINGAEGDDYIIGGLNNFQIETSIIRGQDGNDVLVSQPSASSIWFGVGIGYSTGLSNGSIDRIEGGAGNDLIVTAGRALGGDGNDTIIAAASSGEVTSEAGQGDDLVLFVNSLRGRPSDSYDGENGSDTFVFTTGGRGSLGFGAWSDPGIDRAVIYGSFVGDVTIDGLGPGDIIEFSGVPGINSIADLANRISGNAFEYQIQIDADTIVRVGYPDAWPPIFRFNETNVQIIVNNINSILASNAPITGFIQDIVGIGSPTPLRGSIYADKIVAGSENDTVLGLSGADFIDGREGADRLYGWFGNDTLVGGVGNDILDGEQENDSLYGGLGSDLLFGGFGDDRLEGEQDNDTLWAFDGSDTLLGGGGNDSLFGEAGFDFLDGQDGTDQLNGGAGNDTLLGGEGTDTLFGEQDNDLLFGWLGADVLWGGDGADVLWGEQDNDTLLGEAGNDVLLGVDGNDVMYGWTGNDTLYGWTGDDVLWGEGGADRLFGEAGNDIFIGGLGRDTMTGGQGADRFFNANFEIAAGEVDLITDYDAADRYLFQTGAQIQYFNFNAPGYGVGAGIHVQVAGGVFILDVFGATAAQLQAQTQAF